MGRLMAWEESGNLVQRADALIKGENGNVSTRRNKNIKKSTLITYCSSPVFGFSATRHKNPRARHMVKSCEEFGSVDVGRRKPK